jgi:molybdate transport system substrate-binding protein
LLTTACRPGERSHNSVSAPPAEQGQATNRPIIVSAAASTREVLEELARQFEKERGVQVRLNLGGSNALAAQILHGAPADLFLSASPEWVAAVADAGLVESQAPLLVNTLVIVVPSNNPAGVHVPRDLLRENVKHVALAGEMVPAGKYADQALRSLDLLEPLSTSGKIVRGQDVRVTLSYVERGEAEAGIVYATDARISERVVVAYTFAPDTHDPLIYVLAQLKHNQPNPVSAEFAAFLQSSRAAESFESRGFGRPAAKNPPDARSN